MGSVAGESDIEVIVVDDCSIASEVGKLKELSYEYPLIKFVFLSENTGGAGARNKGAEVSLSKWMWFLDDDDSVASKDIRAVLRVIKEVGDKQKMLFLSANFIKGDSNRVCIPVGDKLFSRFSRYGNEVNTSCVLFSFSLFEKIGGWDADLVAGQDTDILLRASELTDAYVLSDVFVDVIQHDGERITKNPRKQMKAKFQFVLKNYKRLHPLRLARYVLTFFLFYPYLKNLVRK
ncbi:Putative colanic acid biosynthesis glycosyl transferase wcaA [Marinobacter sp. BSs20148]|nr:Putative colanic acid biosynthesis glycosyl transferase wcaA [Marinobacter sp. BSs20148]